MTDLAIKTLKLTKKFDGFRAVNKLNLEIEKGWFFGFLGPNGAGKTTAMRMMTGRLRPTEGDTLINGTSVKENPINVKSQIGVLEDEPKLYERLTPVEFLEFVKDIYNVEDSNKVEELLSLVDLEHKRDSLIIDLSHGMRKKVGLAAELIHEPEILFLDEPFAGIDPVSSKAIKDALVEMTNKGITIFLSTHILEVAEKLCENVAIIDKGEILARGDISNLRRKAELGERSSLEDIFLKLVEEAEEVEI
ncbi:MAG: ABC-type multidrug transport system, ATPase component CcmA [Candidatus Methanohalarchaeum thermophilum]|uniref:ABC-type multidrug transport system, ATPase component CcmA n=1 Tax=Methanohalarchaeum thermophilum TaxID=1903181 RepID=A0A1Q6DSK8_METT1|nr:MAG: ABC-type multidrug transport system, ATPase component CcmA [Candidatus Methanohalarchaeum thermophilum]